MAHTEATSDEVHGEEDHAEQRLYLDDGRQVRVVRDGAIQALELRAASGQLELRIRMTEDGPVLSLDLAPRSAYQLCGDVRWRWQHSVPATKALRYSITFRTLAA